MHKQFISALQLKRDAKAARAKQGGFVMIPEWVLWVGLVVIALTLLFGLYRGASTGTDAVKIEEELIGIRSATISAFSTQGTYGTADVTAFLANSSDIPTTLKRNGTGAGVTITNKWGGAVSVVGNGANFLLNYGAIPKEMCNKIATRLNNGDWPTITIKGTAATVPLSPAAADAACTASNAFVLTGS